MPHPSKAHTHSAGPPRLGPCLSGSPCYLGLVPFFETLAKSGAGRDLRGIPLFRHPFCNRSKNAPSRGRGFEQGFCKRAGASGKKERTHRAPIVSLPPSHSPGLYFVPVFAISFPTLRLFPKPYSPGLVVSSQARKNPGQNKAPPGGTHPQASVIHPPSCRHPVPAK